MVKRVLSEQFTDSAHVVKPYHSFNNTQIDHERQTYIMVSLKVKKVIRKKKVLVAH